MIISINISNFVATGNLKQAIDLKLTSKLSYVRFDLDVYRCAYIKTPEMHSKVSVFETGKMISIGTKSRIEARQDLVKVVKYLTEKKIAQKIDSTLDFQVRNIVITGEVDLATNLKELYSNLDNSMYEPDQFPAIIHHPIVLEGISILIFQSGKFVAAGLRKEGQIKQVVEYMEILAERRFEQKKRS